MRFIWLLFLVTLVEVGFAQQNEVYQGTPFTLENKEIKPGEIINVTDAAGKKQGLWIRVSDKKVLISAGRYKDNSKVGIWNAYYPNGKLKSEITYVNNQPDGFARVFYENGNLSEEGLWKGDKWVGEYKFYYESGKPCYEWKYNDKGERTGQQKYFHENGKIKIEGDWKEGKEQGTIREYFEDGTVKSEKTFENGRMDPATVREFNAPSEPKKTENQTTQNNNQTQTTENQNQTQQEQKTIGFFDGNGNHKIFHPVHKKVEKEGFFVNGKLMTGKHYIYDDNGNLIRLLEYEDGVRIKDERFTPGGN